MKNLLYIVSILLFISWAIGFFAYGTGNIIHVLLVLALFTLVIRIFLGTKEIN